MKNINTEFKLWPGDDVYYVSDSKVYSTYVFSLEFQMYIDTQGREVTNITYKTQNGRRISDKDIDVIYFTDKKKLIQKLVSEI